MTPRLLQRYREIVPELLARLGGKNPLALPRLEKIVINMGVSEARENIRALDLAARELSQLAGQKPQIRRAKKSIAGFKLRAGMPIGLRVTLRGARMWHFLDRLIMIALPRLRDFKGVSARSFDGHGNLNLGLSEQYLFPEVAPEGSDHPRGMNISLVTTARNDEAARVLLSALGLPFRKSEEPRAPKARKKSAAPPPASIPAAAAASPR